MEIIPQLTPVLLLVAPFLVTYAALHVILFRPLMDYLEEREAVSDRAIAEAADFETATADKLAELEQKLLAARRDIGELRKQARTAAAGRESEILAAARAQAEATVDEAVARIEQEKHNASTQLRGTAKILSGDIAAQVLGRATKGGDA